jgi:adenylate cyclase class IV
VEIMAPEAKKDQAQAVLVQVASDLGLQETERRSYLEMFLLAVSSKPTSDG